MGRFRKPPSYCTRNTSVRGFPVAVGLSDTQHSGKKYQEEVSLTYIQTARVIRMFSVRRKTAVEGR